MKKTPRDKKTEVDLTTLLDPAKLITGDDCFGKEWDPSDKDCAICHDVEICGIVAQEGLKKKKRDLEKKKGPFLDMTAFEKVPMDSIVTNIINYAEDGDPATMDELIETIGDKAQTKDKVAIREYIKRMLPRYNLIVTNEKTIVPNESSSTNINPESPLTEEDSVHNPGV